MNPRDKNPEAARKLTAEATARVDALLGRSGPKTNPTREQILSACTMLKLAIRSRNPDALGLALTFAEIVGEYLASGVLTVDESKDRPL